MSASGLLNGLLGFIGGLAAGWVLHEIAPRLLGKAGAAGAGPAGADPAGGGAAAVERPKDELRMILCVNTGLGMGKGKIGAQCAHAAVGLVQRYQGKQEAAFRLWDACGHPKIALKTKDEADMAELETKAQQAGLMTYIVLDEGRTQIAAGSQTVLAIGPAPKSQLDLVTGHLSLM